jgi:hypothetical protein
MLSEQVLEELVRSTPLQQTMVETAWPSLSTESRLQAIHAIQGPGEDSTPTWLMELCIADPAPIVRYWAARRYLFSPSEDREATGPFAAFMKPAPENEKLLRTKTVADPCELVRACASEDPWEANASVNRLVFARNKGTAHLVTGLSKAVDAGMPDEEVFNMLKEVLRKPQVQVDLKFKGMYQDGDTAYYEGDVVKDGWALVRKAGKTTQWLLAEALPTDRGLARITPTELATMPTNALKAMAWRRDKTKEIDEALNLVLASPEKYDAKVIDSINSGLEVCANIEDGPSRGSGVVDRGQETLDQVLALQGQVQELAEQLAALRQMAGAKKGWFS